MLCLAWRMLGPERAVVVTDGLAMAGQPGRSGDFAGGPVAVEGRLARRPDGTIVGSVATMDEHFRNAVRWFGGVSSAFAACSRNPARVAGAAARKGALTPGMDADVVLVREDTLEIAATVCRGVVAHRPG
jgi:N-acetylglucosamine-6-phosphate deacetylase